MIAPSANTIIRLTLSVAATTAAATFLLFWADGQDLTFNGLMVLPLGILVVAGMLLVSQISRKPVSAATVVWFFFFLFYGLIPVSQHSAERWKWIGSTSFAPSSDFLTAQCFVLITLLTTAFLYRNWTQGVIEPKFEIYEISKKRLKIALSLIFLGIVIVIAISGIEILLIRGGEDYAQKSSTLLKARSLDRGTLIILHNFLRPFSLILALALIFAAPQHTIAKWLSICMALILNIPTSTPRYYLFAIAFVVISAFLRRTNLRTIAVLVFFIFGFYLSAGFTLFRHGIPTIEEFFSISTDYLYAGHFNNYEALVLHADWIAMEGYSFGKSVFSLFAVIIPREFWPNKPLSPSLEFASGYLAYQWGAALMNVGAPTLGSFFRDFGLAGAPIAGGTIALVASLIDTGKVPPWRKPSNEEQPWKPLYQLFIMPLLAGGMLVFLRGNLWFGTQTLVLFLMAGLLLLWVMNSSGSKSKRGFG